MLGYFNAAECPSGWSAADGTNDMPDLRGEFVRGLDSGRGVDAGRPLRSAQAASGGSFLVQVWSADGNSVVGGSVADTEIIRIRFNDGAPLGNTWWGTETQTVHITGGDFRPRNIAFLACIKS